jgi:hypothetical protein
MPLPQQHRGRVSDYLAPLAGRGRRAAPGEGDSRRASPLRGPLTPTLSPQAGRGSFSPLSQQHRIGAVHGVGAVDHGAFERACLHRDVFGEEPRQRDIALRVAAAFAGIARGQCFAGEHAAAERGAEQSEIRRRAGQRVVRRRGGALQEPAAGALERGKRVAQPGAGAAERRIVGGLDLADDAGEFVEQRPDRRAAIGGELSRHQVDRLDAVGAFIDRGDARVAVMLRGAGLLDEAHAAMDLDAERGDLVANVGGERLCDRRQQRAARRGVSARLGIAGAGGDVERHRGGVADGARRRRQRAHLHQHPLDVGMHDDRIRTVAGLADRAALAALLRKGQRLLVGAVGDPDAFEADAEAGLVHHREHAEHAAVFLADEVADRAAVVAHGHGAGRRGVHAELVLDAAGVDVVARTQRAVGIDQEFRNQKQRNAFGARRRVGQSRQHEMHDVVGHVVVAIGDEDFCALDAVAAVGRALGAGAQRPDVGARLRLGELHGAGPFARDELFQIDLFQLTAAMGLERLDRAERQERAEPEGDVRRAPDLGAGSVDRQRQALAAERLRPGHRVPSGRRPAPVGVGPAGRGGDFIIRELDAVLVADPVERRQHVGGELAGLLQHRGGDVGVEIAVMAGLDGGRKPGAMVEGEQHVGNRRAVGHGDVSHLAGSGGRGAPSSHETPVVSTLRPDWPPRPGRLGLFRTNGRPVRAGKLAHFTAARMAALSGPNSASRRLKWLNSLYRPSWPEEIRASPKPRRFPPGLLGRRQVVRQWILIPPCGGSNPPAPATISARYQALIGFPTFSF